jgi:hypothetical protein
MGAWKSLLIKIELQYKSSATKPDADHFVKSFKYGITYAIVNIVHHIAGSLNYTHLYISLAIIDVYMNRIQQSFQNTFNCINYPKTSMPLGWTYHHIHMNLWLYYEAYVSSLTSCDWLLLYSGK